MGTQARRTDRTVKAVTEIHGAVASGYEAVADAFAENFADGSEAGAACSVYVNGQEAVNLWAGVADPATGKPWDAGTAAMVYSTTKGVTAVCANLLVQRGLLDLDRPVAEYWPEFAAAGKGTLPVRMLLNHQAGLPVIDRKLTFDEVLAGTEVVTALAAQPPVWEPGTQHGYHALTYGWLIGELVRRITGKSLGTFFAEEIARPLGLDFWIGLPDGETDRVAAEVPAAKPQAATPPADPQMRALIAAFTDPDSISSRALYLSGALTPSADGKPDPEGTRRFHASEIPSVNGIGTARSLARLYAACVSEVDGIRLLGDDTVARACATESEGPDRVLVMPTHYGLGFWLPTSWSSLLGPTSFGHPGAGGSLGFADRESRVGFGYVMNQLNTAGMGGDPRKRRLIDAVRGTLH